MSQTVASTARSALPPGPGGWPLVGIGPAYRVDQLGFFTRMQRRYGDAVTLPLGGRRRLFLFSSPEAVEHLLVTHAANYRSGDFNRVAMEFLGDGLLSLDGEAHRRERALVQPAFARRRVEAYAEAMLGHTESLLTAWRPGQVVCMHAEMQRLTLGIAAQAFFGLDLRQDSAAFGEAFSRIIEYRPLNVLGIPRLRWNVALSPYGRMRRAWAFLDREVVARIADRRRAPVPGDIISDLIAAGMHDQQVRDHAMTLLAAGHETTANALTFTFTLLSQHTSIRQRLLQELAAELAGADPGPDDLVRLRFLDLVTREALRLYPPAWTIGRRANAEDTIGGWRLPAGGFALASQWVMHRHPRYWPEPLRFHPERWLPPSEGGQTVIPFTYFPFGGGPRTCIGMPFAQQELKLILVKVLQRFVPERLPGQRLVLEPHVTLRPVRGTDMRLLAR